jgi:hypothetical protein
MDQNKPELTLDESIKQVMRTLPPVIRTYLAQEKYTPVARNLMTKYGLRIDQGGVLEREIMLLLMGIETPDEFTKALIEEARLGAQVVDSIVQDINTQIFVPLRAEEMKSGKTTTPESSQPTPPQSSNYSHLENKIPIPIPSSSVPSKRPALRDVLSAVTSRPPLKAPEGAAKLVDGNRMLEDHEEPHIEFGKTPVAPVSPRPATPVVAPELPKWSPPNLSGASSKESARSVVQVTPANPSLPKSYSSDPYREPIFEEEGKE